MLSEDPYGLSPVERRDTLRVPPEGAASGHGSPSRPAADPRDEDRIPEGTTVAGRYRLERILGRGGMSEVYLADDTRLDRKVALKVLSRALAGDPQFVKRFGREARAASALSHPNVCVIHEVGETDDGRPFIAMELVEGKTLEARLESGPLPAGEIVEIGIQVADALDAAHSKGVVHRDIKPGNVSVNDRARAKVLDFGLAKRMAGFDDEAATDRSSLLTTQAGMLLGTPYYMSPEQALGRPVDHRSDIFSLGTLLYELVTGRPPFRGSSVGDVIQRIIHAQPEAMARFNYELPRELERIVRKCLEKSPDRRYQTARELTVDLENLRRSFQGGAEEAPPPVEILPIEELEGSDIFLAYASVDDQPVISGRQGWISQFHRDLRVRIEQLSGEPVRIWPQGNPLGSAEPRARQEVVRHLPDAKTLLSVLSPPFARSEGCRAQVAAFSRTAETKGDLEVESRPRIFKVVKTPVDARDLPPDVAPILARLRSFEFFEWDPESGRLREFDETFGEVARQRYHERVYDVAHEISRVLKTLKVREAPGGVAAPEGKATSGDRTGGKRIFLAATTADLGPQRDQLQRELAELGHEVVPGGPLPVVAAELEAAVRGCLAECDLAIHLVGDRYGLVPEDTELSVVAFQNRLAAEESGTRGLPRFVWMPRGLTPRDARQKAFVDELVRDPEAHRGAEVISDTLENFKVLLRARWHRAARAHEERRAEGSGRPPRVYLICDPRDEKAIEPLEDLFYERGIEVSLPGFEASEAEVQEIHIGNLRDCDAAVIFYGAGGSHWVDFNIRDLQKAAGYRESVPIALQAVYVAPPLNHRKVRFKSVSVEVIRQAGETFDPLTLEGFVGRLKGGKGGGP